MMGQAFGAAHRISTKLFAPEKANELESVPHEDFQISSPRSYTCVKNHRATKFWKEIFRKHGRCCASSQTKVTQHASQAWLHINHHGAFVPDVLPKS